MKFEVGRYYKTRGGEKVVYIGENTLSHRQHKLFGNENTFWSVDDDGFHVCSRCESSLDIIGEWPEEVVCWVALVNGKPCICSITDIAMEDGHQVQKVTFKGE